MADKNVSMSLKEKCKLILENRKNSNYLVDLLQVLASEKEEDISTVISCLESVFKVFIRDGMWQDDARAETGLNEPEELKHRADASDVSNEDAVKIFANWLHEKYALFVKTLLQLFSHKAKDIQKKALDCLMNLALADYEAKTSNRQYDPTKPYFPNMLFARVTSKLVLKEVPNRRSLLKAFSHYLSFTDIQFYTLKNINKIISTKLGKKENRKHLICDILLTITSGKDTDDSEKLFIKNHPDKKKFSWESKEKLKMFTTTWLSFLQTSLPHDILKKVLVNLHKDVMPYMDDPKLLIDFLTDAYNMEGPVSLLALNGLFILIQQYNLDYPDFFKKLYQLINAETFELKYRERFFVRTDMFLTSVNLPGYMVAAFVKRFTRLSLTASPDAIKIILVLIENLMKRHPSCRVLIHRKQRNIEDDISDKQSDPYDHDEDDPAKCNAIKSSLWELKTLEQHYHPDIQQAVKVFQKPFNKEEKEIADYFDVSYGSMFADELVSFDQEEMVPLAFKRQSLLFEKSSYNRDVWSFE